MGQQGIELARLEDDDVEPFIRAFDGVFGQTASDAASQRLRRVIDPARFVAARSAGDIIGTAGAYSFELSLPWTRPAGCAGVTLVSVRADHRRRGVLTRMMTELLDDAAARDEPFAALWASEGPIYGRFGFGPAIPTAAVTIERAHARFLTTGPTHDVELVGAETAAKRFPSIYDAHRRVRHGAMARSDAWWQRDLADPPERREGAGEKRYAVLGDRGYAIHRLRPSWGDGVPQGTVEVQELVALDPEAAVALWRFVTDTDLAAKVTANSVAVDDPVTVVLDDPVRHRRSWAWPVYVRLVDVPTALAARGYRTDGTVTLQVHDRFRPTNDGTWRLTAADGRATCEPVTDDADLELDSATLATVALGGQRVTALAAAGRIRALDPAAVITLERLLATDVAPWHGFMF